MPDLTGLIIITTLWITAEAMAKGFRLLYAIDRWLAGDRWAKEQRLYRKG